MDGTQAVFAGAAALLLSGFYPLWRAAAANRETTLHQAVFWGWGAWAAWIAATAWRAVLTTDDALFWRYLALCLTACAGVAVLGARRPGAAAWNVVVVGLLAVLLAPALNQLGDLRAMEAPPLVFLGVLLVVGALNYLPTPLAAAVLPLGAACAVEIAVLGGWTERGNWEVVPIFILAAAPWAGLAAARRQARTEFDRLWLGFRDRFGAMWGLRVRDQFNRAAANARWPVVLRWSGLRPAGCDDEAPLKGLRALLTRFGPKESQ